MMVDGKWTNVPVGDEWVASYNSHLLLRFDCHIQVDVVTATACIKYLFKYCHKTEDYARARIQGITDEIELYRKTRYISAAEATWRLLGFQMIDRNPENFTHIPKESSMFCFPLTPLKLNAWKLLIVPTHQSWNILPGLLAFAT